MGKEYGVRFIGFKGNYRVTKEKWFSTEAALQQWLEKHEDEVVEILGFSYPEAKVV